MCGPLGSCLPLARRRASRIASSAQWSRLISGLPSVEGHAQRQEMVQRRALAGNRFPTLRHPVSRLAANWLGLRDVGLQALDFGLEAVNVVGQKN